MEKKRAGRDLGRKPVVPRSAMKYRVDAGADKPFYCRLCKKNMIDIYAHYRKQHRNLAQKKAAV